MFNRWNASLYDDKHAFVAECGQELLALLAPQKAELILDLGCGTGDLAHQISQAGAVITGIDSSEAMVRQARKKYPQLCVKVADARHLDYDNQFDAVFSNAVLHWIKPPEAVLRRVWAALRPGGRFIAEFGGKGNVQAILSALVEAIRDLGFGVRFNNMPWFFPSIGEYALLMEKAGFQVTYASYFARPTRLAGEDGLRNWISMFACSLLAELPEDRHEEIIAKAESRLKADLYCNGVWTADYKRIRVAGIKAN